ncbi:regulator of telomere elongation helicase 1 homolog [Plodia interpunctella]|uniref:regulator of telomere elongation helicase 1 homolog n=1 Tax=Plodia interpunctella TaxID=58824 RepID=UPI0023686293|nr:regulator of telomere elongation helicase 1 homolog [Plodia interpunctella]
MPEIMISGIPVTFPFEPYEVQKAYMGKVIDSLQNNTNALLESPTGTGKTLSLLCSSLAWLLVKKAQLQMNAQVGNFSDHSNSMLHENLKSGAGKAKDNASWGMPKIIYSSRTHSQLTQAMQELKRSSYRHVKAAVLGSRDQMCIHPEVSKETNNTNKVHMCQLRVKSRTCHFYNNVESKKEDRSVKGDEILDIEDLVTVGKKLKCCPYYLSKELKQEADIIFMPYNYILDPKSRKANGVELMNNIIILDEAHNVEKMCEEAASLQIRTTDVALCIDEITHVMRSFSENSEEQMDMSLDNNQPKDFTCDDLCVLKEIMLAFEKAIDEINVGPEGSTFTGGYIFDLLAKAEIKDHNQMAVITLIGNLIQFLSTASASPFQRKGVGLQKMADLLTVVYSGTTHSYKERVKMCYKVHVAVDDKKNKKSEGWGALKVSNAKTVERVLSYWCFSPGFGMKQLMEQNVRSIILTSGTLAPLKPLISELGIPIGVQLENPHIVKANQICVKIIGQGPDSTQLNSNFQNRNNPKYISSLGRTILSFCRVVPDGLLIFFPSYPIMTKCQENWQAEGIWSSINNIKPIFVEPQRKDTFNTIMHDYYSKISDPSTKGACFMAVCRGKVSEGLDFADMNGRAVIITGLPFPPFKDPRIVLKKKYLEELRTKEKDFLSGDEWYSLEATRAVNQAIGRVIRHQNDYGAILLCDTRFNSPKLKGQLSAWLRGHIQVSNKFGETVSEICRFFKNAESALPPPKLKPLLPHESNNISKEYTPVNIGGVSFPTSKTRAVQKSTSKSVTHYPNSNEVYANFSMDFYKKAQSSAYVNEFKPKETKDLFSALDCSNTSAESSQPLVKIHKRSIEETCNMVTVAKKKKLKIKPFGFEENLANSETSHPSLVEKEAPVSLIDFVKEIKTLLHPEQYKKFQLSISLYKKEGDYSKFLQTLKVILENKKMFYLFRGMKRFLKEDHKNIFQEYCDNVKFDS